LILSFCCVQQKLKINFYCFGKNAVFFLWFLQYNWLFTMSAPGIGVARLGGLRALPLAAASNERLAEPRKARLRMKFGAQIKKERRKKCRLR